MLTFEVIRRHFYPGQIRIALYHGSHRRKLSSQIFLNDIVFTTFETVRSEWSEQGSGSVLFSNSQEWGRVVLDEGQLSFLDRLCLRLTDSYG